jgi:hypothetical protein
MRSKQPDPADRRQHHLHADLFGPGVDRDRGLPDDEPDAGISITASRSRASTTGAG